MGTQRITVALWTALAAAGGADGQQSNIIVRVYDYAGLAGNTLRNASLEAQKIFPLPSGDKRPAAHAYVFYHRVEEAAEQAGCTRFRLLGHVMAHEVGHLLLGVNEHSSRGIMRPRWLKQELTQAESGQLVFHQGQAGRLRAAIRARQ